MPYENAKKQLLSAINLLDLNELEKENVFEILSNPDRIIKMNLKIKMDNWKIKNFVAFRSQHCNLKWPYKGWIRFHSDVTENEVKALSILMTIKTSIIDLPLWGWKWGIIVNPKELSKNELERLSREYVRQLHKNIWSEIDIPAPDVNTNWQIMTWMVDEYQKLTNLHRDNIWAFTGKPIEIGGSLWREEATWYGWIKVLETYLEWNWENLKWKKIIVQGFWNVWQFAILKLLELWSIIIWMSDSKWAILKEEGFDKEEILYFIKDKNENKMSLFEISKSISWNCKKITNEELLEQKCDILIPSALENVINKNNYKNIKTNYILELANWPIENYADIWLFKLWIIVIPDVLANSGWVLVSYLEQVQNKMNYYWSKDEVLNKMNVILERETKSLIDSKNSWKWQDLSLRNLIYKKSIGRLVKIMKLKNLI